jgi:hypothetical protein
VCIQLTECLGGAAGIARRDGTIEFECGHGFVVDAAGHLRALAGRERANFVTQEVEDGWLMDVGRTGAKFVYVIRPGRPSSGRVAPPAPRSRLA